MARVGRPCFCTTQRNPQRGSLDVSIHLMNQNSESTLLATPACDRYEQETHDEGQGNFQLQQASDIHWLFVSLVRVQSDSTSGHQRPGSPFCRSQSSFCHLFLQRSYRKETVMAGLVAANSESQCASLRIFLADFSTIKESVEKEQRAL